MPIVMPLGPGGGGGESMFGGGASMTGGLQGLTAAQQGSINQIYDILARRQLERQGQERAGFWEQMQKRGLGAAPMSFKPYLGLVQGQGQNMADLERRRSIELARMQGDLARQLFMMQYGNSGGGGDVYRTRGGTVHPRVETAEPGVAYGGGAPEGPQGGGEAAYIPPWQQQGWQQQGPPPGQMPYSQFNPNWQMMGQSQTPYEWFG